MNEGDALIRLKSNRIVELVFAEDDETVLRDREYYEQEVYKTAVQFALMIDTFFKNGEGLDTLIMHSPTGSIAAELLGKDLLSIELSTGNSNDRTVNKTLGEELEDRLNETQEELNKDNVVDATNRFKKEDNDEQK